VNRIAVRQESGGSAGATRQERQENQAQNRCQNDQQRGIGRYPGSQECAGPLALRGVLKTRSSGRRRRRSVEAALHDASGHNRSRISHGGTGHEDERCGGYSHSQASKETHVARITPGLANVGSPGKRSPFASPWGCPT
jgi:hypothetical protein